MRAALAACGILRHSARNKFLWPRVRNKSIWPRVRSACVACYRSPPRFTRPSRRFYRRGSMRIAQIAPLTEAVPPKLYGGTERIVSYITDELATMGHEVTLFASGDSTTKAKLEAAWPRALRLDPTMRDYLAPH